MCAWAPREARWGPSSWATRPLPPCTVVTVQGVGCLTGSPVRWGSELPLHLVAGLLPPAELRELGVTAPPQGRLGAGRGVLCGDLRQSERKLPTELMIEGLIRTSGL